MITPETKPIYSKNAYEFADTVERALLQLAGGRPQFSSDTDKDGRPETHDILIPGRVIMERDNPPDDPMGTHIGWAPGFMRRNTMDARKELGLQPTFKGGATSGFAELHSSFRGAAACYGALLDKNALRDSGKQGKRVWDLLQQWSDEKTPDERRVIYAKDFDYPKQLAEELALLPVVPLKIYPDGDKKPLWVKNILIHTPATGESGKEKIVSLAHALLALEKNALSLTGGRPLAEVTFITSAVHEFSRILMTTEVVYPELLQLMKEQGIENAEEILKKKNLGFDAKRADEMLTMHAPFIKLATVIAPLVHKYQDIAAIGELLGLVNQKIEDTPPVINAEHGARLLEAMLHYLRDYQDRPPDKNADDSLREQGLDVGDIKRYLRKSAHDRPFDVAALGEHPGVQRLIEAAQRRVQFEIKCDGEVCRPALQRALDTWNRALERQEDVKRVSTHREKIQFESMQDGMNADAVKLMFRDILSAFEASPEPEKLSYSAMAKEWREKHAERARKEIPPMP